MKLKFLLEQNRDAQIILTALLFFASACLGYFLKFNNTVAMPTWPPSGIAFALIILLGRSAWPGITIGALIANLMAYWNNPSISARGIIAVSVSVAVAYTVEALIGNYLVKYWIKNTYPFNHTKGAFQFLFITLLMCLVGAVISTSSLYGAGVIARADVFTTGLSWWIGDVGGILLFTPVILGCLHQYQYNLTRDKFLEIGIVLLFFAGLIFILRLDYLHSTLERSLPFLVVPFLLWLAFRFDLVAAMAAVLVVSLFSIYYTTQHIGPFVLDQPGNSMLLLQIFIAVISVSTIILSATVRERVEAQQALLKFNETLEVKVEERTRALHEEIDTRKTAEEKLQRTNQELNKRNTELDNFVYSVSHDLRSPIATVQGLINLAKKEKDALMKDMYLDMIDKSTQQQDYFIREILDQSRNARLEIKREEILFQPIIDETISQLKYTTAQSLESIVTIHQERPFYSDRWRLKVILNNILSNSIRFRNGKDPLIKVNVDVAEGYANVKIEDNGKGISEEHLANVFRMFYRATDEGAGSGLGLYIVKEAIDKLNGSIRIDSKLHEGTTVFMQIPEVLN